MGGKKRQRPGHWIRAPWRDVVKASISCPWPPEDATHILVLECGHRAERAVPQGFGTNKSPPTRVRCGECPPLDGRANVCAIPHATKPLTPDERKRHLEDLQQQESRCHTMSHTRYLRQLDLEWAFRYETTIRQLERDKQELSDELDAQLRLKMGDKIVDESLEILRGSPKPDDS